MSLSLLSAVQILVATQAATPARVIGTVSDGESGLPLAGVVVTLSDLNRDATTDADGHYILRDVPAGPQHLLLHFIGYVPRALQVYVPQNDELEINVSLTPDPVELPLIEVRPPIAIRGDEPGAGADTPDLDVPVAAAWNHPLLAEPDAFQALEGSTVAMSPESPNGVHIRGGASDQTAYLLDGIPIFSPYHAAGLFSAWNPDALSELRVSAADPSPGNPDALSGTISASTRTPGARLRTQGTVSTSQARLTLDGPLGSGGAGFLLSARSGLPGMLSPNESSYLRGETSDWLGKIEAPVFGGHVRLLGYQNQNAINASAALNGATSRRNSFQWESRSLGGEWRRAFTAFSLRLQGWSATGSAASEWDAKAGPVELNTDRQDLGVLAEAEHRSGSASDLLGVRVEQSITSYRVVSDSDSPIWNRDARTPVATLYGDVRRQLTPRGTIELGASLAGSGRGLFLGPRGRLHWDLAPTIGVTASFARLHQFAQSLRNAESVVGNIFPADLYLGSGAPGVPVARSDQGILALDFRPVRALRLGVQAYARNFSGLVLVAPSQGEPFSVGGFAVGSGDSRGVSLDAAVSTAHVGFLASYRLQQVRLRYGGSSYVPDIGATHQLDGGVIVFPTVNSSIRLGASTQFGRRTTTIADGFEWEACNLVDKGCEFGGSPHYDGQALGGTRLPAYVRVDLGARQRWHFEVGGRHVELAVFGTITNLLGRTNILTYARSPVSGRAVPVEMRPRSPLVLGIDWRF